MGKAFLAAVFSRMKKHPITAKVISIKNTAHEEIIPTTTASACIPAGGRGYVVGGVGGYNIVNIFEMHEGVTSCTNTDSDTSRA